MKRSHEAHVVLYVIILQHSLLETCRDLRMLFPGARGCQGKRGGHRPLLRDVRLAEWMCWMRRACRELQEHLSCMQFYPRFASAERDKFCSKHTAMLWGCSKAMHLTSLNLLSRDACCTHCHKNHSMQQVSMREASRYGNARMNRAAISL